MYISNIKPIQILDSRGNPTIKLKVEITDENGEKWQGEFSVPSGASTGKNEALELRDNKNPLFNEVRTAIKNLYLLMRKFRFQDYMDFEQQLRSIDDKRKTKYGGNTILALSGAVLDAFAKMNSQEPYEFLSKEFSTKINTPQIMANFINGGKHAKGSLTFQEFLVVSRHDSIKEAIYKIAETYHKLKNILEEKGLPTLVGDEGGFSPPVKEEEALEILSELIKGQKFSISLDIAASSFYNGTSYKFHGEKTPQEMLNYYRDLCSSFNIFSLEDPFQEEDFEMHQKAREFVKVVGDDLLTTNTERMKINPEAYDMAIIKMNQIGTISETIEAISFLHSHQKEAIVSHRSGETCNTLLVDLAIATGSEFVKIGAPARGERTAKYNRLLELL